MNRTDTGRNSNRRSILRQGLTTVAGGTVLGMIANNAGAQTKSVAEGATAGISIGSGIVKTKDGTEIFYKDSRLETGSPELHQRRKAPADAGECAPYG